MKDVLIIGRKDKVDFPDLDLKDVPVKIDSGARTSSLHCDHIEVVKKNGKEILRFNIHHGNNKTYAFDKFETRNVKSSSGHAEVRYVIKTLVVIFGNKYSTEFTLTNRSEMNYPVLLGRRLLRKNFVVDVRKSNLSFKKKYE